ncbi:MAG: hypothetical protein HYS12_00195 [Planctomycetes bacterium]|nr:hypothetical protein [Planctomycetota bacterium]
MMWRDRILAWGLGLAAGLLPGCFGHHIDSIPDGIDLFNVGEKSRGTAESPFDRRTSPPAPQQPSVPVQAGPEPPPYPQAAAATDQSPQTASTAAPTPPTPRGPAGGSELQAVVHEDARPKRAPTHPPEPALLAALRCYREGQKDEARKHLQTFDPSTRELLERLLLLAVRVSNVNLDKVPPL